MWVETHSPTFKLPFDGTNVEIIKIILLELYTLLRTEIRLVQSYLHRLLFIWLQEKMTIKFPIDNFSHEKRKWISLFVLFMVNLLNYMDRWLVCRVSLTSSWLEGTHSQLSSSLSLRKCVLMMKMENVPSPNKAFSKQLWLLFILLWVPDTRYMLIISKIFSRLLLYLDTSVIDTLGNILLVRI